MKHQILIVSLLFLLLPLMMNAQEKQASNLDTKISIQIEDGRLIDLFNAITLQTGIYFSYDPLLVNSDQPVSVQASSQTILTILTDVFHDKFQFKLLKNQLIITGSNHNSEADTPEKSKHLSTIIISGKLVNQESKEQIPYASISLFGKTLGTISNVDGEFALKIPPEYLKDTVVISCMGYARKSFLLDTLKKGRLHITLEPIKIQLREVKVEATDPIQVMDSMINNIPQNYPTKTMLMTSFYREVLKQDKQYVNVAEALMDILKTPYTKQFREDQIRYLKGRKSKEVQAFKFVDFKMQGGPYYITKLDVIKTLDSFVDREYRSYYKYKLDQTIEYRGRPTYVIAFEPAGKFDYLTYKGKLFIDKQTFALVHAEFSLSKDGKKSARRSLIRKKPKDFNVRPLELDYDVSYKRYNGKWYLNSAQASVEFRVKSKRDKVNSIFHSISNLLITDYRETNLKRFKNKEDFDSSDIFSEIITDYDPNFWGDYNVIEPSTDLKNALKKEQKEKSLNNVDDHSKKLSNQHVQK